MRCPRSERSSPMGGMIGTTCTTMCGARQTWIWRSSSETRAKRASRCYPSAGSSNAPWLGSRGSVAWQKTTSISPNAANPGSISPPFICSPNESPMKGQTKIWFLLNYLTRSQRPTPLLWYSLVDRAISVFSLIDLLFSEDLLQTPSVSASAVPAATTCFPLHFPSPCRSPPSSVGGNPLLL